MLAPAVLIKGSISQDESSKRRREKRLARAGNTRVRRGMIQLAWRFRRFQKESALVQRSCTPAAGGGDCRQKFWFD
jgi:transposase